MNDPEVEIQSLLDKWRMRKAEKEELKELEESVQVKETLRNAKIAISGRLAATELLEYGVSHHLALPDRCRQIQRENKILLVSKRLRNCCGNATKSMASSAAIQ